MMKLVRLAALVAAGLLACAPAAAQRLGNFPAATTVTPTDGFLTNQPSLCAPNATCSGVLVTPVQLASYITSTGLFQASDADLTAIAALATQGYGRTLLTMPDAPTTRAYLGLGLNALDSTPRAPAARLINTTAPLTGGGDLSADRTLGISLVNGVTAGAMSAPDKVKLDSVNIGASVSSVACTGTGGISCSVTSGTTAAQLTIAPGALTPNSVAATGTVTGSNLSGTNTGDQIIALTGDVTGSGTGSFAATLAPSGVTAGTYGASGTLAVPVFTVDLKGRVTASSSFTLGTSAGYAIGISGGTIGLLNGSNFYSGAMTFSQVITGSVTGNAGTATKLATPRKVNGVAFDGSADITVNAVDSTPRLAAGSNLSDVASPSVALANLGGAPLVSPALTGTPTVPTAPAGTATTQVATTGFADGLRDVPQNRLTSSYTLALSDRGKHLYFGDNNGNTVTIPANATTAFPIDTRVLIVNLSGGSQTIAGASGVSLFSPNGIKSYTLAASNVATLLKVDINNWVIFGNGLS